MKKQVTFFLALSASFCFSQTINFADSQFKSKLLQITSANVSTANMYAEDLVGNSITVDANGDGEIQVSEAQNIKILKITSPSSTLQLSNVGEISYFSNLKELNFSKNNLSAIDLIGLNFLENINLTENKIASINVSHLTNLKSLIIQYNLLTSLDVSNKTGLTLLFCDYNPLTNLKLTNTTALESLSCTATSLVSIDMSDSPIRIFVCNFNSMLESLNINNGTITTSNDIWYFNGNPNIAKICADAQEIPWLESFLTSKGYNGVNVSNCTSLNSEDIINQNIKIYPNPVSEFLFLNNAKSNINKVQVLSFDGKLVYEESAHSKELKVDFNKFEPGVYLVRVYSDKEIISKKIIKK